MVKVGIGSIRETRGGVVRFQGEQIIATEMGEVSLRGPVHIAGTVTNTGEGFLVQAKLAFEYEGRCARCLETFLTKETVELKEQYTPNRALANEDSLFYFNGDVIDLTESLREQVILAIPMKLICDSECRGLCPECGSNLNQTDCQCISKEINLNLLKLKSLLSTEGGGLNGEPQK